MKASNQQAYINPIDEQRESALQHYEDLAMQGHHWSSFVVAAIKAYNPQALEHLQPEQEKEDIKELNAVKDLDGLINTLLHHESNGRVIGMLTRIQQSFWLTVEAINKIPKAQPQRSNL